MQLAASEEAHQTSLTHTANTEAMTASLHGLTLALNPLPARRDLLNQLTPLQAKAKEVQARFEASDPTNRGG